MGVFLAFGFAFEGRSDDFGGGDLLFVGDVGCGRALPSRASTN